MITTTSSNADVTTFKCMRFANAETKKVVLFESPITPNKSRHDTFYLFVEFGDGNARVEWMTDVRRQKNMMVSSHGFGLYYDPKTLSFYLDGKWLTVGWKFPQTKGYLAHMASFFEAWKNKTLTQNEEEPQEWEPPQDVDISAVEKAINTVDCAWWRDQIKPIPTDQGILFVFEGTPYQEGETEAWRCFVLVDHNTEQVIAHWVRFVDLTARCLDYPLEVTSEGQHLYYSPRSLSAFALRDAAEVANHPIAAYRTPRLFSDEQERGFRETLNILA